MFFSNEIYCQGSSYSVVSSMANPISRVKGVAKWIFWIKKTIFCTQILNYWDKLINNCDIFKVCNLCLGLPWWLLTPHINKATYTTVFYQNYSKRLCVWTECTLEHKVLFQWLAALCTAVSKCALKSQKVVFKCLCNMSIYFSITWKPWFSFSTKTTISNKSLSDFQTAMNLKTLQIPATSP